MNNEVKNRVSELLNEASKLLAGNASTAGPSTSVSDSSPSSVTLQESLRQANNMLRQSTSSGLCRSLNRQERLRAAAGATYQRPRQGNEKSKKEKKAIEFALLRCFEDDEVDKPNHLKWDSVITSGVLMLHEDDDESTIRGKVRESLTGKFPLLGTNDFEFVKVWHKAISTLHLGPGTEYNFTVVKKIAGQGLLYLKVKQGFQFLYKADDESDEELLKSVFDITDGEPPKKGEAEMEVSEGQSVRSGDLFEPAHVESTIAIPACDSNTSKLIDEVNAKGMTDPVEILKFLQKEIVQGRALDVADESEIHEGETNYICVDRNDILQTTFTELASIKNFKLTFEVDFMGERARDLGGPRKEWIRLMNTAIKETFFDNRLQEYRPDEYYFVGIMIGIALLQNGQLPMYMPIEVIDKLVTSTDDSCITNIQRGLDVFGLGEIIRRVPILLHLLRPTNHTLAPKMLLKLLTPQFSEEGSSAYLKEKKVYALFVKYVREVGSGRRAPITLSSVLIFTTGAAEEPVLGFAIQPCIRFVGEQPKLSEVLLNVAVLLT